MGKSSQVLQGGTHACVRDGFAELRWPTAGWGGWASAYWQGPLEPPADAAPSLMLRANEVIR